MLRNYFLIAIRNIIRQKGYFLINIAGLSIGMACSFLIFLWVLDEINYDCFNENLEEIHRVIVDVDFTDKREKIAVVPAALGPALKNEYPEILNFSRVQLSNNLVLSHKDKSFNENNIAFVDPTFLDIFTYSLEKGKKQHALSDPKSIVITNSIAEKYFGNDDPIGKTLTLNSEYHFKVTAILKDIPGNSHLRFNILIPVNYFTSSGEELNNWADYNYYLYVLLKKNTSIEDIDLKISHAIQKHDPEYEADGAPTHILLQGLKEIHLHSSDLIASFSTQGDITYVYIFSIIAIIVLLIACINFMNLTTARAGRRAKEIGMRKVSGAIRSDIIKQFYGESLLMTFIAMIFAIALVEFLLPTFNTLSEKSISFDFSTSYEIIIAFFLISILTGIISGSYPALYLSSFQPIKVLKSNIGPAAGKSYFRKALVVLQFSISIFLIICTAMVFKQLHFMSNKDPGYEMSHVVFLPVNENMIGKYKSFKKELLQYKDIEYCSAGSFLPMRGISSTSSVTWTGQQDEQIRIDFAFVDYDYIEALDLELIDGRSFSKEYFMDDSTAYIVNEEFVKIAGYEKPIGQKLSLWDLEGKIIGVAKDFHFMPMHFKIEPLIIKIDPEQIRYILIKVNQGDLLKTVNIIEKKWKEFFTAYPFKFFFMDQGFDAIYKSEKRMSMIFNYFTWLALFISCLGLFGLTSLVTQQRTKEIGIRKVFGASTGQILFLLSKEFTQLIFISNILAWPISYIVIKTWLQNFAYQASIPIWIFVLAGLGTFIIALLTIMIQAVNTAMSNPIDSLKYE